MSVEPVVEEVCSFVAPCGMCAKGYHIMLWKGERTAGIAGGRDCSGPGDSQEAPEDEPCSAFRSTEVLTFVGSGLHGLSRAQKALSDTLSNSSDRTQDLRRHHGGRCGMHRASV